MALPTLTADQIEDIYATTFNYKMPDVVDNVYNSNPFIGILNAEERILLDGGRRIEQAIIYGKLNGGFYGRNDTFNTARVNTKQSFIIDWKFAYVDLTIDGIDDLQNAGASAVFDNAAIKAEEAELTLKDTLGANIFIASTGNSLNGLEEWIDDGTNFASIGGITRDTSAQGSAVKGNFNATGGSWTIPALQTDYGSATIENEKPTLIVTGQALWNALFNRVTPLQRYPTGPGFDELAKIGFDAIKFQRAAVVVDSHVQSGRAYGINTRYVRLIVHAARNAVLRGWMPTGNKDERVNQLLWAGNLICTSPRMNFQERNLTA